ncbi:MAG: outer membrane protein assembly factor BamD, partial [Calditrichaeota bacterium]
MMRAVLPDLKKRLLWVVASCVCLMLGQDVHGQTNGKKPEVLTGRTRALVDSVWRKFTLEDLLEFRTHYRQKTEELLAQKAQMRANAISDLETFLQLHPDSPVLDQVIVRLAEMYIEQASYDFAARSEEYNRLLEQYDAGQLKTLPKEPEKDFSRPFALYQMLLDKFPRSELVDDVLYSRAFLLEDLGQTDQALTQYQTLVQTRPESPYVPNALMRIAEYYFNPPNSDLEQAIAYYNRVLEYKESPNYDAALYRLGWAYYTLTDYPSAIAYFTLLADDVDRMRELDPQEKYHFPAVRDEAVEYVGISFVDFGGPERAAAFLQQIGGRPYGFDILKKIADSYLEAKEDIPKAITAYELLLRLYPDAPEAPRIEAQLADAYERLNDEEHAYAHRRELFQRYRSGTGDAPTAPVSRRETGQLAAKAMRENINDLLRRAETSEDTR